MIGIRVFSAMQFLPVVYDNMGTIVAVLLVYPPVIYSFFDRKRIEYWRLNKQDVILNLKWFAIVSLIVFPVTFLGNHIYQSWIFKAQYHEAQSSIWLMYALTQLLLVAFPEEFFFRGYLQKVFMERFPGRVKIFGVSFGWGIIFVCLIFAFSHSLITLQWWHGFIFFPALLFAWLKEKTQTIWAAVLFHWCCNLFSYWVAIHYS